MTINEFFNSGTPIRCTDLSIAFMLHYCKAKGLDNFLLRNPNWELSERSSMYWNGQCVHYSRGGEHLPSLDLLYFKREKK